LFLLLWLARIVIFSSSRDDGDDEDDDHDQHHIAAANAFDSHRQQLYPREFVTATLVRSGRMDGPNKTLRNRFELLPTDDNNDDDDDDKGVVIVIAAANVFVSACETRWNSYNDQPNDVVDSKGVASYGSS
jgi:protein involved in sex pheromone biosynthesis